MEPNEKLKDEELNAVSGGMGFIHAAPKQMRDKVEAETFGDRKTSGSPAELASLPSSVEIHDPYKS